jgi:hypothetical protein
MKPYFFLKILHTFPLTTGSSSIEAAALCIFKTFLIDASNPDFPLLRRMLVVMGGGRGAPAGKGNMCRSPRIFPLVLVEMKANSCSCSSVKVSRFFIFLTAQPTFLSFLAAKDKTEAAAFFVAPDCCELSIIRDASVLASSLSLLS